MGFCKFTKSGRPASVSGDRKSLSLRGVPQGHLLRGAQRRGNPFFSCKETDSHASDAVTGVGMTGSGTSGTPSPTTAHRTHPQGAMPTHRPAGQMRILRRDTWVPPYRVRRSCRTGRRDAVPYNGLSYPSAGGRCPHIAPPAAQRGRRKRLPACRKSPDGLFRQAGRQNRKIKTTFYFAILVAAAGDWTRKGTLTVPFHTILPSDICDRTGSLTG